LDCGAGALTLFCDFFMNEYPINIKKYLKKNPVEYSLEFSSPDFQKNRYSNIVVIPVFAESDYLPETLKSLQNSIEKTEENTLVLIVINNPPIKECDPAKFADNQSLLGFMRENRPDNTAWVDASSPGREIKKNGGVGAARKIGMDLTLTLFDWNSNPLVFSLDADTIVEDNYVYAVRDFFNHNPEKFALTLNFKHQKGENSKQEKAIRLYEAYIKDYACKLAEAGSPYAYYSIGSTIVCKAETYVKAGGMRAKNGGEDFYFLQAVRKLDSSDIIGHTQDTTVCPSSRASDRVPFGTGPRIEDIISGKREKVPGKFLHHPDIFLELKKIIASVENGEIIDDFESWYENLPLVGSEFFDICEFRKIWPKILLNTPDDTDKIKWAFHTWFDAFRTLKFIHFCEDCNPANYGRIENDKII
jgi:glycosyltransferase involved in cell wall biosynthesis